VDFKAFQTFALKCGGVPTCWKIITDSPVSIQCYQFVEKYDILVNLAINNVKKEKYNNAIMHYSTPNIHFLLHCHECFQHTTRIAIVLRQQKFWLHIHALPCHHHCHHATTKWKKNVGGFYILKQNHLCKWII